MPFVRPISFRVVISSLPNAQYFDVVDAITGKTKNNARNSLDCVKERYPEVARDLSYFRFPGRGQRNTPVVDVRGIVEIVMFLPGRPTRGRRIRGHASSSTCGLAYGQLVDGRSSGNKLFPHSQAEGKLGGRFPEIRGNMFNLKNLLSICLSLCRSICLRRECTVNVFAGHVVSQSTVSCECDSDFRRRANDYRVLGF